MYFLMLSYKVKLQDHQMCPCLLFPCCRSPLAAFLQEPELTADSLKGASLRVRLDTICETVNRDRGRSGGCNDVIEGRTPLGILLEGWNGRGKRFALEVLQKVPLHTSLQYRHRC